MNRNDSGWSGRARAKQSTFKDENETTLVTNTTEVDDEDKIRCNRTSPKVMVPMLTLDTSRSEEPSFTKSMPFFSPGTATFFVIGTNADPFNPTKASESRTFILGDTIAVHLIVAVMVGSANGLMVVWCGVLLMVAG